MMNSSGLGAAVLQSQDPDGDSQLCSETSMCDDVWQPGIYTQHPVASVGSALFNFSFSRELAWITRTHLCFPTEEGPVSTTDVTADCRG